MLPIMIDVRPVISTYYASYYNTHSTFDNISMYYLLYFSISHDNPIISLWSNSKYFTNRYKSNNEQSSYDQNLDYAVISTDEVDINVDSYFQEDNSNTTDRNPTSDGSVSTANTIINSNTTTSLADV